MQISREVHPAKRGLCDTFVCPWKKHKSDAFLSQETESSDSSKKTDSLQEINEANMNGRKNYSLRKKEMFNDDVAISQHETVESECKILSEIPLIKVDCIQICQLLPSVRSRIAANESQDGKRHAKNEIPRKGSVDHQLLSNARETDSSPIIPFCGKEDLLPKNSKQNIPFNKEINEDNENIELDAEFCTDWCISEVRGNCDVFFDEVKSEAIQDFVECNEVSEKMNESKTIKVNDIESCDRRNISNANTAYLNFSCTEVLLQRTNINGSEYQIPNTSNDSEFQVEKLSRNENLNEVGRRTEISISDLISEKIQIACNPSLSSPNKYIAHSFLKQNEHCKAKKLEPSAVSNLSLHNMTPSAESQKNQATLKHKHVMPNDSINIKSDKIEVSKNDQEKNKSLEPSQNFNYKRAVSNNDLALQGEKCARSENGSAVCRRAEIQHKGSQNKQNDLFTVNKANSETLTSYAENRIIPRAFKEPEGSNQMTDSKCDHYNVSENLHNINDILLMEAPVNCLWRPFNQPKIQIKLTNNRKQSCNSHLKESQCTSEELTSCDKMKFLDKEEIKKEHKENIGDLSEYVNSWKRKNPWMKYYSSVFYCKICLNSQLIFKVKNLNQIFKVAFYLRQHESSAKHKQSMFNLSNKLIKHTIEHIKHTAFKQTSKETLFFSLSEHLRLTEGMDIHECNEYIFSTVFKEFTTFLEETELAFLNSNMTKSFSYIIDECRQILIVRTIGISGHPVEILITKLLEKTGIFKFGAIIDRYLFNAVFVKRTRCGMCDTCKKMRLSDTNETLPLRYPNAIDLTNMLQNDPAVIKYIAFVKKNIETVIKSQCSGIIKECLDWTHLELLNILKLYFAAETKTFSYIEVLLQIILKLNKANIKRNLLPQDLNNISNLINELKCTLNSTSIEFIELFLNELLHNVYYDGASNVKYFENIFNPYFMMNVKKYPVYYEAFLQIFRWIKKHLPEESPDSMMNHLAMFGQYVNHTRNMSLYVMTLSTILQMFQEDLLLRQQFSVVQKFYELISLLPFLCASHEISFYCVSASFSVLIKKYGRPLAYQIMRFMHADNVLVHQFQENRTQNLKKIDK